MFPPRSFDASTPVIFGLIDERYMPTPPITYGERTTAPGMDRTAFALIPMTLTLLVLGDFALNELYMPSTRNPTGASGGWMPAVTSRWYPVSIPVAKSPLGIDAPAPMPKLSWA